MHMGARPPPPLRQHGQRQKTDCCTGWCCSDKARACTRLNEQRTHGSCASTPKTDACPCVGGAPYHTIQQLLVNNSSCSHEPPIHVFPSTVGARPRHDTFVTAKMVVTKATVAVLRQDRTSQKRGGGGRLFGLHDRGPQKAQRALRLSLFLSSQRNRFMIGPTSRPV